MPVRRAAAQGPEGRVAVDEKHGVVTAAVACSELVLSSARVQSSDDTWLKEYSPSSAGTESRRSFASRLMRAGVPNVSKIDTNCALQLAHWTPSTSRSSIEWAGRIHIGVLVLRGELLQLCLPEIWIRQVAAKGALDWTLGVTV